MRARHSYIFLKINEMLLAGISTIRSKARPFRSANARTSSTWRRAQSGFCLRNASSKARLLGAVSVSRSEEHTSELQSLMRISHAVFCWKKKTIFTPHQYILATSYISWCDSLINVCRYHLSTHTIQHNYTANN